jgi:hypothetical protein
MESHIRIKVSANFVALQQLQCSEYKVLLCLSGHADSVGRCFPSCATIAKETNLNVRTVYDTLAELITYGYVKYLRKSFLDPVSGQQMNAVYQVSPFFLEIADKFIESALLLWGATIESKLHINQQQSYASESNTINQLQETTTTTNKGPLTEKPQKAKSEPQPQEKQREQQAERSQRSLPTPGSAIVKKYTNPISIIAPLPDELSERLAERLNQFKIALPLARGFVFRDGYAECEKAANYYEFVSQFQEIKSPGGFYRSILEHKLADETLTVDAAANTRTDEYDNYLES